MSLQTTLEELQKEVHRITKEYSNMKGNLQHWRERAERAELLYVDAKIIAGQPLDSPMDLGNFLKKQREVVIAALKTHGQPGYSRYCEECRKALRILGISC